MCVRKQHICSTRSRLPCKLQQRVPPAAADPCRRQPYSSVCSSAPLPPASLLACLRLRRRCCCSSWPSPPSCRWRSSSAAPARSRSRLPAAAASDASAAVALAVVLPPPARLRLARLISCTPGQRGWQGQRGRKPSEHTAGAACARGRCQGIARPLSSRDCARVDGASARPPLLTRKSSRLLCASRMRPLRLAASGALRDSAYPPPRSTARSTPRASSCASPGAARSNVMTGENSSVMGACRRCVARGRTCQARVSSPAPHGPDHSEAPPGWAGAPAAATKSLVFEHTTTGHPGTGAPSQR